MKGLDRYTKANLYKTAEDIDFHEFYEMVEEGMSHTEIAEELGVSKKVVDWLAEEIEKDV
jgi:orotate phosphoribosyltransferase-like protein